MTAITFDTLEFAEQLKASGIPDEQAKAHARVLSQALEAKDLATKQDLAELEARLETRLTKWMIGVAGGQAVLIVALLKLLP